MDDNALIIGTDRYGRTWRVKDWGDQFVVYYTGADGTPHTLYDSRDQWADPPRVLLARAEQAEQRVRALERKIEELKR